MKAVVAAVAFYFFLVSVDFDSTQFIYSAVLTQHIMMEFTAVIKKGEKQFVALCPEVDVASQGPTVEKALENLKEAVELYIEEMGVPEGIGSGQTIVSHFEVKTDAKTSPSVG